MLSIMVVEDDISIRDMLKDILEQADFEVITAGDTHKALLQIQQSSQSPALIVSVLLA